MKFEVSIKISCDNELDIIEGEILDDKHEKFIQNCRESVKMILFTEKSQNNDNL